MAKQVGLKLDKKDWEQFKTIVPIRNRMKKLESFVFLNNVKPDLEVNTDDLVFENLRLSEEFLLFIDAQVDELKERGISTSRSAVMRSYIKRYTESTVPAAYEADSNTVASKRSSYYFEKGTRLLLDQWIGHRNRSSRIEDYLVSQSWEDIAPEDLMDKPSEIEPIRINFNAGGTAVIDQIVSKLPGDTSRSAVLRYVVAKMLGDIIGKPFSEVIAHSRLKSSIEQYRAVAGDQKVSEVLIQYRTNDE